MTSLYRILSFCRSYFRVPSTYAWSRPGCPQPLTKFTSLSPYIQYTTYHAHAKSQRPIACLSFSDIMDLTQTLRGSRAKRLSLSPNWTSIVNIAFSGLKDWLQNSAPLWWSLSGVKGQLRPKYSCLGGIVMSLRTPILNRLIPMLCSCIWSTRAYFQQRKPTC